MNNGLINKHNAILALADAGIINYSATGNGNGMIQAINVIKALPEVDAIPVLWLEAFCFKYRFCEYDIDDILTAWKEWKEHESIR